MGVLLMHDKESLSLNSDLVKSMLDKMDLWEVGLYLIIKNKQDAAAKGACFEDIYKSCTNTEGEILDILTQLIRKGYIEYEKGYYKPTSIKIV